MSDLIDRQDAIDALTEYGNGRAVFISVGEAVIRIEQLPPANCSEFPNSSDTISRQQAIEALKNDMASLDHIIKGMSANDVRLDAYVSQRNQVNYDIYTINNLPPAQPEQLGTNLAEVGTDCISRQAAIDGKICIQRANGVEIYDDYAVPVEYLKQLPPAQPKLLQPWEVLAAQAVLPQPKMGKWIYHIDDLFPAESTMECNQCHAEQPLTCDDEFCPHCGAKMEVTE